MRIQLTKGQFALVDDDLFELFSTRKWCAVYNKPTRTFYAVRGEKNRHGSQSRDSMHWYVVGKPIRGLVVDHINGDTLDNRRENLRIVSYRQNNMNSYKHRAGRLAGCYFHKRDELWVAQTTTAAGKRIALGWFKTEREAHDRYMEACHTIH